MKILLFIMLVFAVIFAGCTDEVIDYPNQAVKPTSETEDLIEKDTITDAMEETPSVTATPAPKISSNFEGAPSAAEIENETNIEISEVLLQDTLTYEIPLGSYFAVALEEDASKQYRWLLASDDGKFEFVEETHLNGYRVFIFYIAEMGETSLLFELTQNTSVLVETLSYQLKFVR